MGDAPPSAQHPGPVGKTDPPLPPPRTLRRSGPPTTLGTKCRGRGRRGEDGTVKSNVGGPSSTTAPTPTPPKGPGETGRIRVRTLDSPTRHRHPDPRHTPEDSPPGPGDTQSQKVRHLTPPEQETTTGSPGGCHPRHRRYPGGRVDRPVGRDDLLSHGLRPKEQVVSLLSRYGGRVGTRPGHGPPGQGDRVSAEGQGRSDLHSPCFPRGPVHDGHSSSHRRGSNVASCRSRPLLHRTGQDCGLHCTAPDLHRGGPSDGALSPDPTHTTRTG